MTTAHDQSPDSGKEKAGNSPVSIPDGIVYAYNLDETKTAGGLKVRWKVRVISGPAAARWDDRQNTAIMELLQWASRHQHR